MIMYIPILGAPLGLVVKLERVNGHYLPYYTGVFIQFRRPGMFVTGPALWPRSRKATVAGYGLPYQTVCLVPFTTALSQR